MSGMPITVEFINQIWPVFLGVVVIVYWLNKQFSSAAVSRNKMETELKHHMDAAVKELEVRLGAAEKELLRHKLYAAEVFATKAELKDAHTGVVDAINKLDKKLDAFLSEERKTARRSRDEISNNR